MVCLPACYGRQGGLGFDAILSESSFCVTEVVNTVSLWSLLTRSFVIICSCSMGNNIISRHQRCNETSDHMMNLFVFLDFVLTNLELIPSIS